MGVFSCPAQWPKNFEEKRAELDVVCEYLNNLYQRYAVLKARYDEIMGDWKQQRRRGFITTEECQELAEHFEGARTIKIKEDN